MPSHLHTLAVESLLLQHVPCQQNMSKFTLLLGSTDG